ncbi:JAB domain-containing protein [Marinomonas flavescens]|uniref:JAB domain-containing protein n=1 Tax=Marinomonas flavescens TaxID=2529379 RepID=UPI0010560B15|nr:JAB domain-containing protein [Marinomonas flavescens]
MTNSNNTNYSLISLSAFIKTEDDRFLLSEPVSENDMYNLMLDILEKEYFRPDQLTSPEKTKHFLQIKLGKLEHEVFGIIFMDSQHKVIAYEELFRGTIDGAAVYPREVLKRCLHHNAAAVIFAPHPSGSPEPSNADIQLTKKLKEALSLIDIRTLDHLIIGGTENVSMAERGLL